MFLIFGLLGLITSIFDFSLGLVSWGTFLLILSGLNFYNFFTWEKKLAAARARHEQYMKEYEASKAEQRRKIDELYGK